MTALVILLLIGIAVYAAARNRRSRPNVQPTPLVDRVAFPGLASPLAFGAGLWLERRYERTYSALAAVGVGIAGGYTTLLAAVSLYDLVSKPVALVAAAAIASVGLAVSLAWSEEVVAG